MSNHTETRPPFWMGLLVIAVGLIPMSVGAEPSKGVPEWMIPVACSVFILGGLCLIGQALGLHWVGNIFGPMIMLIFAGMFIYIGFGPGERECTSSFSFGFFRTSRPANSCRAFGYFGLLTLILFIVCSVVAVRSFLDKRKRLETDNSSPID